MCGIVESLTYGIQGVLSGSNRTPHGCCADPALCRTDEVIAEILHQGDPKSRSRNYFQG
jgi:hypothetical protein